MSTKNILFGQLSLKIKYAKISLVSKKGLTITKTNLQRNEIDKQINSIKYLQKSHV